MRTQARLRQRLDPGLIVVSYEGTEAGWRLTVCDDGAGKPEVGAIRTTPGLGTSIVEALAKQLEGQVEVSRTMPHGMTVSITHGVVPPRLADAA